MNSVYNAVLNGYSIAVLVIICVQIKKQNVLVSLSHRIYMLMVKTTLFLLLMDSFARFNGEHGTVVYYLNHLGNFMLFAGNLFIPSLWLFYVYAQTLREDGKIKRVVWSLLILNIVNVLFATASGFTGWLYYYDQDNNYIRGPLFPTSVYVLLLIVLIAYGILIKNRKRISQKHGFTLAFFAVLPCAGVLLQVVFLDIAFMLNCLVLSLLLVFLNIQSENLYKDYLTGVHNRKRFDMYLREKIRTSSDTKTFSAIMLDINDFKNINDKFGHDVGDSALKTATKLLNRCVRNNDFIARLGGDEFCIILDLSDDHELEVVVNRIDQSFLDFSQEGSQPYEILFSRGYAVYDHQSNMNMEEFLKKLDMLMYEDKQKKKSAE